MNNVIVNDKAIADWLLDSAKAGSIRSQYDLGILYLKNQDSVEEKQNAILWLTKAASSGCFKAQYQLGLIFKKDDIVEQDYLTAFKWFNKSANLGNKEAQYQLALMHKKGLGVPISFEKSLYWLQKSAKQHFNKAQFLLAAIYLVKNTTEDYFKAYIWNQLAVLNGFEESDFSNLLTQKLSCQEIDKAQSIINECVMDNFDDLIV